MKDSLKPGLSGSRHLVVDQARTIDFLGEPLRVYATPAMVNDVEFACRDLILPHSDPGEDSVGMHVEVEHLLPTLPGMQVDIVVAVAEVQGRKVTFRFFFRDELDEVGRGSHTRFVVDTERLRERLANKRARLLSAGII